MLTRAECLAAADRAERYPRGQSGTYIAGIDAPATLAAAVLKRDPALLERG